MSGSHLGQGIVSFSLSNAPSLIIITTTTSIPLVKHIGTMTDGTASGFQGIGVFRNVRGLVGLPFQVVFFRQALVQHV
jgi:hypothetical protein